MEGTSLGNFLHPVQLTGNKRPVLQAGEFECSILDAVDLEVEENSVYPILKEGLAILTTHKIIWVDDKSRRAGQSHWHQYPMFFFPENLHKKHACKA